MALIHLPSSLANYTQHIREVSVEGKNLKEALKSLVEQFPNLKDHIVDAQYQPLLHLAIFIDDEQVATNEDIPLKADSEVRLVLALSGG